MRRTIWALAGGIGAQLSAGAAQAQPAVTAPSALSATTGAAAFPAAAPAPSSPLPPTPPSAPPSAGPEASIASSSGPGPGGIALHLAAGFSSLRRATRFGHSEKSAGQELHADVGWRVHRNIAVGGHFGLTVGHEIRDSYGDGSDATYDKKYGTMEAGVSVQIFAGERVWLAPWIGIVSLGDNALAGGISAGVDFVRSPKGHRLGAYVAGFQTESFEKDEEVGVRAVQLGLAYGFR